MRNFGLGALRVALALLTTFAFTIVLIKLAHGDPRAALTALWSGAFGDRNAWGNTLTEMTPLLLTGLGVAIAFRAKLFNIGGEGQFLVGALAASAIGAYGWKHLPSVILLPLALLSGALAGAVWSGLAGVMRVARGVPEVISTIMLNFIALQLLSYLVHGPMQESSKALPSTESLPPSATLPILLPQTTLHAGFLLALLAVVVVAVFLTGTRAGFALRAVGANADAARVAGIAVSRVQIQTMLLSGALCGLAGAVQLSGKLGTLSENYSPGYGFAAVAVALLGRLNPLGLVASAFFFGALTAGSGAMERSAHVSSVLVYVIQAVALLTLLGFQWTGNGGRGIARSETAAERQPVNPSSAT